MNVLVCGANGFIGRHACAALEAAGHRVFRGVHTPCGSADIRIDYSTDLHAEDWLARLAGIDAVVNAVGILCEDATGTFGAIHRDAPCALFDACERAGVRRVIQISALGGEEAADKEPTLTPYMRTKREADAHLMSLPLDWTIFRPSLVVGIDGDSSRLFRMLASLPVIGLPGRGDQRVQPVHVDDLAEAIVRTLAADDPSRRIINAAGPQAMTYREMLSCYRHAMALPPPLWLPVPMPIMRIGARLAAKLPQRVFAPDTLQMLEDGNTASAAPLAQLLGRPPKGSDTWFAGTTSDMLRADAIAAWSLPLLRVALAIVWIVTGILSLGVYPRDASLALLARAGLHGSIATIALYGAALLDCAFGIASIIWPGRALWRAQMGIIAGYTIIISIFLPEYWLHPFGPVLKNIPIFAVLFMLDASERQRS